MPNSTKLIFPEISARLKEVDGEKFIWDSIRQMWLLLTPEEWVRQHTIAWLIGNKGIPALRISQEYPVNINGQHQRADIVVIDERAKPYILVECKAPNIEINNEVVMQATRYNAVVKARYILLTNGKKLYCYEFSDGQYRAVKKF
ncbi:MAG: type I restriction enzyme HsdR N-terminal domain-containing protein [Alistipes sp.]|nr:type I restriction enzyme HsdR N-terminal domain-containing protein [Alistipes sp.]